jgi:hypothetical protein
VIETPAEILCFSLPHRKAKSVSSCLRRRRQESLSTGDAEMTGVLPEEILKSSEN